jgi:hypothetical protein
MTGNRPKTPHNNKQNYKPRATMRSADQMAPYRDRRPTLNVERISIINRFSPCSRRIHSPAHIPITANGFRPIPRDGATVFSDLIGKLDVLRVSCGKCERDGRYGLARLINQRGRDAKILDWLDELTAECPKKIARNMNDSCGAKCPQLPKVL